MQEQSGNKMCVSFLIWLMFFGQFLALATTTESPADAGGGKMNPQIDKVVIDPQSYPGPVADMKEDKARSEATFQYTVQMISKLNDSTWSPAHYVRNLPWKIMVMPRNNSQTLGFYLECNAENKSSSWSCSAVAQLRLLSVRPDVKPFCRNITHLFNSEKNDWGYESFIAWNDVLDPEKGYIKDDAITLEVHMVADVPHDVASDAKNLTAISTTVEPVTQNTSNAAVPLEFPNTNQNYTFVDNSTIRKNFVTHSESKSEVEDLVKPDKTEEITEPNSTLLETNPNPSKQDVKDETLKDEIELIEDNEEKTEDHKFDATAKPSNESQILDESPMDKGIFNGTVAAILIGTFLVICFMGYIGLLLWRRFLEMKYGSREILVNEDDFMSTEDLKHFSI